MDSLADFIHNNLESILKDWEKFARATGPASMSVSELRDDAEKMLRFIVADMGTAQTPDEQRLKSEGHAPGLPDDSAAHDHGRQRFAHGFDMNGMVAEYRALRATVIRLWAENNSTPMEVAMQQLVRFNEGIDQAITESIARYTGELDKSRDLFLAALGHDLRSPLATISITAEALLKDTSQTTRERGQRILRSSRVLGSIANDLLDFTRTRMGGQLPLQIADCDLVQISDSVVQQLRPAYPDRPIEVAVTDAALVQADSTRIAQALTNLVLNALQHGDMRAPVSVRVSGTPGDMRIEVHNAGEPIAPERIAHMFEPWTSGLDPASTGHSGLGLYIVRQIALAHGGQISVTSSHQSGTAFTLSLPRARRRNQAPAIDPA